MDGESVLHKLKNFVAIFLIACLLILVGCHFESESNKDQNIAEQDVTIEDLVHTDYFRDRALEHILEGELNARGQAVGFHYDGLPSKKGKIISGTDTSLNEFGVYEAEIEVDGVRKTSNGGKSSFFPDKWTAQQVVDAINEAYDVKQFLTGNTYEGITKDGVVIRMYLDQQDKIISAFPVY